MPALLVLLVAGAGAGYYLWSQRADAGKVAIAPAPAPSAERVASLESVRAFLASSPDAAQARTWAAELAKTGKLLDGQFLLGKYAAEKGDAEAARTLGAFYDPDSWTKETSPLPSANPIEAARWFKQAAEAGDAEAQYRYAMLLKKGRTDEADGPEQSVAWLRKAADQGHEAAKKALDTP
ncbi:hypothetical protein A8M77_23675 [Variovorax sp. JS1663]|nr:hypothetical protein A8M77_23675 [Variovorax sp. JS1663]